MCGSLALPSFSGAGPPYSHHGWLEAVAACVLIRQYTTQGKRFGTVLRAAGTRKVDRRWKRSEVFRLNQTRRSTGGEKLGEVLLPWLPVPREAKEERDVPLLSHSRCSEGIAAKHH